MTASQPPDHHGGLVADRPLLSRRGALVVLGGAAATAALAACSSSPEAGAPARPTTTAPDRRTTSSSGAASTDAGPGCHAVAEDMAGPFLGDGSNGPDVLADDTIVRRDIRSSYGSSTTTADGVPLTVHLDLRDTAGGCAPMAGAAVYLWQCDRDGRYSLYSDGVTTENYLRGVRAADQAGRATFDSLVPGCYPGRWPHLHFEVFDSVAAALGDASPILTSQVAIPEAPCAAVYATPGYEASLPELGRLSLDTDGVFGDDGGVTQLGTVTGDVASGLTITLAVPV